VVLVAQVSVRRASLWVVGRCGGFLCVWRAWDGEGGRCFAAGASSPNASAHTPVVRVPILKSPRVVEAERLQVAAVHEALRHQSLIVEVEWPGDPEIGRVGRTESVHKPRRPVRRRQLQVVVLSPPERCGRGEEVADDAQKMHTHTHTHTEREREG
jgi:hypothetical protein